LLETTDRTALMELIEYSPFVDFLSGVSPGAERAPSRGAGEGAMRRDGRGRLPFLLVTSALLSSGTRVR